MRTSRLKPEREGSVSALVGRVRDPRRRSIGRRTKEAVRPEATLLSQQGEDGLRILIRDGQYRHTRLN